MSLGLAFRAFFAVLFDRQAAAQVRAALQSLPSSGGESTEKQASKSLAQASPAASAPAPKPAEAPPKRSEALTLLSTLQREARLIDLIMEPLDAFEDAQIGAAAREVLRDSRKTLSRMLAIEPISSVDEGDKLSVPDAASPAKYRLTGASQATGGVSGTVTHRGWQATKCEVPKWTGSTVDANVIAPIEVEV